MSVLESLKNRAGLLASAALSFAAVLGGLRLVGGEPVVQPLADVGIVIVIALMALFFVIDDTRGGAGR